MIRLAAFLMWCAGSVAAQSDGRASVVGVVATGPEVAVELSAAVPWRVFVEGPPWRLILDTAEVDWTGLNADLLGALGDVRTGRIRPGWSRLVVTLEGPRRIDRAWMETEGATRIHLSLTEGVPETGPLVPRDWDLVPEQPLAEARDPFAVDRPLVVALDPGHGGLDPGAERDGVTEADLMLRFARELGAVLEGRGHRVVLTRDDDSFVSLRGRPAVARAGVADLLISLHADAVTGGGAEGATVYTLGDTDADDLSAELVRRHGAGDLLLGIGETGPGDQIERLLIELSQRATGPRSARLAGSLVATMERAGIRLHKRPRLGGRFTVLKAPDIPSVLLELGFMSSDSDLANLLSPDWRRGMADAIADGVETWAAEEAAAGPFLSR